MELAGDEFVGVEQDSTDIILVDIGQADIVGIGVARISRHVSSVNQTGRFGVGRVVASRRGMAPMHVSCRTVGGIRLPRTSCGCVATSSRILAAEKLRARSGGCCFHGVGTNRNGDDLVALVVGVLVIIGKVHGGTNDETAGQVVGRGVKDGVSRRRRPFDDLVEGLASCQRIGGEIKRFHHETNGVNNVHRHRCSIADT